MTFAYRQGYSDGKRQTLATIRLFAEGMRENALAVLTDTDQRLGAAVMYNAILDALDAFDNRPPHRLTELDAALAAAERGAPPARPALRLVRSARNVDVGTAPK